MSISRETFDPTKNYKRIRYHQDRDLLDSELNEQQDIINLERRKIADILFKEGSIIMGLEVSAAANVLTLAPGVVYIDGHLEQVSGATLTYDPATTSGSRLRLCGAAEVQLRLHPGPGPDQSGHRRALPPSGKNGFSPSRRRIPAARRCPTTWPSAG